MANHRRRLGRAVVSVLAALLIAVVAIPWVAVWACSHNHIYSVNDVAYHDVTLVLGASMWGNEPSPYLQARIDLAAALYKAGKTKVIIVSGSRDGAYNEPDGMTRALVADGVPAGRIVQDYSGDDTYTSCQRARDIYGVTSLILVSQSYHVPRAVAACRLLNIDAVGVGDNTQAHNWRWYKYQVREVASRAKMLLDVASHRQAANGAPSDAVSQALANG